MYSEYVLGQHVRLEKIRLQQSVLSHIVTADRLYVTRVNHPHTANTPSSAAHDNPSLPYRSIQG
jgi:hypothetical protein